MPILDDLAEYLEDQSVGTVGTDIFVGRMPKTPGDCLVLFETGGQEPEQFFGETGPSIERPSIQVLSKHLNQTTARSKIQSAWTALAKVHNQNIEGTRYLQVAPVQSPLALDVDETGRFRYVANFNVWKAT